jgi:hypothetical protein
MNEWIDGRTERGGRKKKKGTSMYVRYICVRVGMRLLVRVCAEVGF